MKQTKMERLTHHYARIHISLTQGAHSSHALLACCTFRHGYLRLYTPYSYAIFGALASIAPLPTLLLAALVLNGKALP
jgi:hypothetical protein